MSETQYTTSPSAVIEVGNTPMVHAQALGSLIGLPYLYLKVENRNPTGTQKDRAALALVLDAVNGEYKGVTIGTCGNFGASLAGFCRVYGIKCTVFMPVRYKGMRSKEMVRDGAAVIYTESGYEDAVARSAEYACESGYYDANPTSQHAADISIESYGDIAIEIDQELSGIDPGSVWVAVGNGTTLAGIYEGFRNLRKKPAFGAVSSKGNNAILTSFEKQAISELDPGSLIETRVNEPLLNYRAFQVAEALDAIGDTGWAYGATDAEMIRSAKMIYETEGIMAHPASASVLAGLAVYAPSLSKDESHVLVLTS